MAEKKKRESIKMVNMSKVEFVSYDGKFPNLCRGNLTLKINGNVIKFPKYCMRSGGSVLLNDNWAECIESGMWSIDVPEEYAELKKEVEKCVNENVPWGCCGGCV